MIESQEKKVATENSQIWQTYKLGSPNFSWNFLNMLYKIDSILLIDQLTNIRSYNGWT